MFEFIPRGIKEMVTGEYEPVDPNNPLYFANQFKDDVRSKVSENMEGWQSFLYQTGLSIGDFLSIAPLSEVGSLAIMGSNAASSAALNVAENGGSATQALWTGAAAGAAEVLFEKISLDQLKLFKKSDKTGLKEGIKNIAKGMFTEGSEEAATDVANLVTDALINADNSDFNRAVKEYQKNGLTEEAAWKQAALDTVTNIGLDFAGGALSGAALSAGATALGAVDTARLGSDIKKGRTDFTLEDMTEAGKTTDPTSRAYQIADKVTTRQEQGKRIGNYQAGALYRENINETRKQTLAGLKEELSGEPEYKGLSRAFEKVTGGEKLSSSDAVTIQGSPKALTLLSDMTGETLQADSSIKQIKQAAQNYSFQTWTNEKINKQLIEEREQLERDVQEKGLQLPTLPNLAKAVVDGTPVRVMGIQDIDQGTAQVRLSDGKTVSLDQVEFTDPKVQQVYRQAAQFDTTGAKEYVSNYTENPLYTGGFQAFYRSGKIGLTFQQAIQKSDAYAGQLSTETMKAAYDAGVQDYHAQVNAQQQKLEKSGKKKGSVEIHTTKPLTDKLKSQTVTLNRFAEKYGLQIELVDEIEGGIANGVYTGKNHIQIAADNLEQGMLFTALHEAGHYVKANNPKGFQELSDFVLDALDDIGYDVTGRIDQLQEYYRKKAGQNLTEADALEEIVCDHLSVIAADEKAVGKLLSLDKNRKLKILEVLKSILEKIKTLWTQLSDNEKVTEEYSVIEDMARRLEKSLNDAGKYNALKESTQGIDQRNKLSIKNTRELNWKDQLDRYFSGRLNSSDCLYLGDTPAYLQDDGILSAPLYMPTGVITKGMRKRSDTTNKSAHDLSKSDFYNLKNGVDNPIAVVYNPGKSAIVFITDNKFQNSPIVLSARINNNLYGELAHKTTSVYPRENIETFFSNLPEQATVYVENKNKFDALLSGNGKSYPALLANIKLTDSITPSGTSVNIKSDGHISNFTESKTETKKYSLNPEFVRQYDAWDKKRGGVRFEIGNTSKALKSIGINDKAIVWDSGKIVKIKSKHPAMTDEVIKQVPNLLENPVVIMKSKTADSRITLFGEVYDANGKPVLAVVELNPTNYHGVYVDELKLASAYGKDTPQTLLNTSRLLYLDPNKERTNQWLLRNRLYLPLEATNHGPINIISNTAEKSNNGTRKYSLNPDFVRQYDAWDKKNPLQHFRIGNTSEALRSIGVEKKDIVWDSSKIIKIKAKHPAMTDEVLKQVPNLLENPVVVMESKTVSGRLTMLGEVYDQKGTPVLAVLELHPTKNGVALDELKLASAYGKEHIQRLINTSRLLYVDPNKNRTDAWLKFTRLQLPVNNNQYGPIDIISNSSEKSNNGTRKYSLNPEFVRQYDAWDKKAVSRKKFEVGTTSQALQSIGVPDRKIYWDSSKIAKIREKHKNMTDEVIKQVPFLLENPVVVMQSKSVNSRITILGDVFDASGKPVLAVLELEPMSNGNYLSEMKIASAYGKDAPQHLINTSKILYVEPNKNRTHEWLNRTRLQLPFGLNHYGPINIISNSSEKSNQDVKKFSLKQPVEEAAGLMAVHNLTEEKLKKALKLGGLPVPSIAVVKAKNGNINFGEISLLFDKETIDPQNKENLVFDRDVYSNTYPDVVKKDGKSYLKQGKKLVPATLGNIVSAMKGSAVNSEQTQHYLIQNVAAAVARRFYSIDEIRRAKGKLMSVKEYEDHLTALLEREDDVSAQICFDRMVKEDAFEVLSDYYRAMTDYLTKGISARSALKRHGFTLRGIEADTISRFEEIAQSVKTLPTDVFEAKPQRAVGFDEVRAAIVPQGLDPSVKEALSSRGIEVVEYDPHMKGDRLRALNENKTVQFSLKGTEEDYNALVKKYGAIKKGVNPARDIKVPKRSSDDKKVRQLTRTVLETESVTPELIDEIKKGIVNEDFSYTPISDKEAKSFADWKVNTDGMENAQKQWAQVTGGMRTATKKDIAVAEYMLLKAEADNDIKTALRLINEISIEATRAGQTVQAMSMLKRLGGIGQLTYIKKTVDKLNAQLQKRAKKNKKAPQITIKEELAENLIRAKTKEEMQRAADVLLSDIANQIPATWVDKWNAWRYFSMLGNPRTHIRNLTGNAVFMPAISFKNVLAAGMEKAVGLSNGDMTYTKAVKVKQEYKNFAQKDFAQVKDAVTSGGKMNPSDMIRDKQKIFDHKTLESLRKFNFNLLEKEDILFLRHHYARALSMYLQSNRVDLKSISDNTLIKARKYAINEAQKATFRDASKMANMLNRFSHINKGTALVIEGMLPFKKTPINILKRGVEYSPIGLIKALTYDLSMLKKGEINGGININEFIDGLACGLSGTMIMALGMFLASLGIIQGGMGDDKEGQFEKLKGVQEYSIQIGGVSYTIDWMAPASLPLFVGVELYNAIQGDYENATFADIADSLAQISEPVFEMSMLSGLNNTFDAISFSDNKITAAAEEIVTGYLSQAVPTVLGQTARTIDGTRRRTYIDKNSGLPSGVQRFVQKVMNKTPLSYLNQPYVDQWGREDNNDNIFLRAVENFVSPGFISEIKPTELDDALTELYASTGDTGVLPSSPQKYLTVEGERIDLTGSQYTQLSKIRGNTAQRVLAEMIATPEDARLSDEEKASAVSFAYKYAAEVAKSELLGSEIVVSWCRKAYNQENKSGGSVARYILRNKIK